MKNIEFTKMVATGNDFVVIDNRSSHIACRMSYVAKKICNRKTGIGADGLLLLEKSTRANFKMRIFNPDGSEADMCGNGSRCIALYAQLNKIVSSKMTIETKAGLLSANVKKNLVTINMTEPKDLKGSIKIIADKKTCLLHYINTGVPHAVSVVNDIDGVDVFNVGRMIRYHKPFMPDGTNVDFIQIKDRGSIFMRTYERGVEDETLACGTGAVASAIISSISRGLSSPVKVFTRGGLLRIYFKREKNNRFTNVFLEGEAREVFTGKLKNVLGCRS